MLEIKNLVSGYGKLAIIQDVSFKVDAGDFVAIVGPNGSGKSTLVKSILGLTNIFEGTITFEGTNITNWKPEKIAKLKLGYVPQLGNVFPDLSVSENLELGGVTVRDEGQKRKMRELVVKLFPILKSRSGQRAGLLSGGERQMLAVGRALAAEPKLLILDEPTAALAPIVAEQLFQRLMEIRQKLNVTIILVEQNARKALGLANRGLVLVQGKSAFEGTPDQISKDKDIIRLFLGELVI
ncbi:MAG TPA: ABC transporter ATP-binding protein [Nitrososphaerales archaeon]|nr:ABC transporter ATP-binding protein [Nitrososphaerales archaeon]